MLAAGTMLVLSAALSTASPAVAAIDTVTVASGNGPGSLPDAVANASPGDTIDFNLGPGPATITLPSTLQIATDDLTIIGSSDPQQAPASPLITLRPGAGMTGDGIDITADGVTVQDLSVSGFSGDGIAVTNASRATLTSTTGTPSRIDGNGGYGIAVAAGPNSDNHFGGFELSGNAQGPFSVSGLALSATATLDSSGTQATVTVSGASPGEPVALQAGTDRGCAGSFVPYPGNTAAATTDAQGAATMTVGVSPPAHAPDGIRLIVTGQNDGTVPVPGCVTAALQPAATILAPDASGGIYAVAQQVVTRFGCTEGSGGPGLRSCTDSLGASAPAGRLDTARPGPHVYTVTAISLDGRASTARLAYTVAAAPSVWSSRPRAGVYRRGARIRVSYRCRDGAWGPGLLRCAGPVRSGRWLDTQRAGWHRFTITAVSRDGQRTRITIRYRVIARRADRRVGRRRGR